MNAAVHWDVHEYDQNDQFVTGYVDENDDVGHEFDVDIVNLNSNSNYFHEIAVIDDGTPTRDG